MKKFVFSALLLCAMAAHADSVSTEYQYIDVANSPNNQNFVSLSYRHTVNEKLAAELTVSDTQTLNTFALSSRTEAALIPTFDTPWATTYVRAAIGDKIGTIGNSSYYSVEPGATKQVGDVTYKLGYRYRTSFDPMITSETTRTWRIGAAYAFDKVNRVGTRLDYISGNSESVGASVIYTHSF